MDKSRENIGKYFIMSVEELEDIYIIKSALCRLNDNGVRMIVTSKYNDLTFVKDPHNNLETCDPSDQIILDNPSLNINNLFADAWNSSDNQILCVKNGQCLIEKTKK